MVTSLARFLAVAALLFASFVNAKPIEQMTDEEVAALPKEVIDNLPAIDFLVRQDSALAMTRKQKPDSRRPIFEIEFMLSNLRYYSGIPSGTVSGNLIEAVKKYQRKIGANATGVLLVKQYHQLFLDYSKVKPAAVIPLGLKFVYGAPGFVGARGTWVFRGNQQAYPIQLSKIVCIQRFGICTHNQAMIQYTVGGIFLDIADEVFEISKWTKHEIVARNSTPKCVTYTLTINTQTRDVHQLRRSKGNKDEICKGIADQPLMLDLVDPSSVGGPFYKKLEKERLGVLSPEFAEQLRVYYDLMDAVGLTERY
jgi:hypothetical protein